MSDHPDPDTRTPLDAEAVATYLAAHPAFFQSRQELLEKLDMPVRQHGAGVADMQQYLLDRLREEINTLRSCTSELISVSRNNMTNQDRVHRAVLALLEADALSGFVAALQDDLPVILDIDTVGLCFERHPLHPVPTLEGRIRDLAPGSVSAVLGAAEDIWLVPENAGDRAIFGPRADDIASAAFVRIEPLDQGPAGLLAFGAAEPRLFHPSQGTELLAFLASIVEFGLRRWLHRAER